MQRGLRILKRVGFFIATAIAALLIGSLAVRAVAQHQAMQARPTINPRVGVDELRKIRLGGVDQWIHIRGVDRRNPVLLWIHGGPGFPMMPFSYLFQGPLERRFTVVQWDQRGSGKTYFATPFDRVRPTLSAGRIEDDAIELTEYLRKRFGQDRIVLLGHSWGSLLGLNIVQRRPDLYSVYVGTGQVVNMRLNEQEGYRLTLTEAKRQGDLEAVQQLERLAPYPGADGFDERKTMVLRGFQDRYASGLSHTIPNVRLSLLVSALKSPEYTLKDVSYFVRDAASGATLRAPRIEHDMMLFDARSLARTFQVPLVVLEGRHDWITPGGVAEAYLREVSAPYKKLIWLENSAHSPMLDQPKEFAQVIISQIGPIATARAHNNSTTQNVGETSRP